MESINIEKIMEEIRQEIKEKGYTNDLLSFQDIVDEQTENRTMEEYYDILNNIWNVKAYRLLSSEGCFGKLKTFIKKVIRKSIKFYIEPIVNDQNEFNANNVRLLNMIHSYMELTDQKIAMLEKELDEVKKQIKKC